MTNSDFRLFLDDVGTIGRQVFADTAHSLSGAAEETSKKLEPSADQSKAVSQPGADDGKPPTAQDLGDGVADVSKAVGNGLAKTTQDALISAKENVSGDQGETLLNRLKQAVLKLRKRNDYSDSVSTISLLIKRYAQAYSRAADETVSAAQSDINTNQELDKALRNFYTLLSSFGEKSQWEILEEKFKKVMSHSQTDPQFENLMTDVANSIQKLLTDPAFFEGADKKFKELQRKAKEAGSESNLRQDVDEFLQQLQLTVKSVTEDEDIARLTSTSMQIFHILSPLHTATNPELLTDALHVFLPLIISAIQYIPIPRLEVSVPEIDLLLENLIIEPGRTVNHTSFLPYKFNVETYNDFSLQKHRFRTTSHTKSLATIRVHGLSFRAEEIGFWLRAHSGIMRLADEGIASFALDDRGIDIAIDVEIGKERLEQILTLRAVHVHIHKLTYTLRKSKLSWLAWIFKPFLKQLLRRTIEKQLATAIADGLHAANRELLYARERLRATRISDPQDLSTFVKAILTRLTPAEDPDVYTSVGVAAPKKGIFAGVYAPGSVVKLWNEEAAQAGERVDESAQGARTWRNDVFDVAAY